MALSFQPIGSWHWLTFWLVLIGMLAMLWLGRRDGWQSFGQKRALRITVLGLSLLAGLALILAAWNPRLVEPAKPEPAHLVVVVDVSESVMRAQGGWKKIRDGLRDRIRAGIAAIPRERRDRITADVLTFQNETALARREIPLNRLSEAMAGLAAQDFAAGQGSNLAAGLDAARARLAQVGRPGAVLLISDGNQTEGEARAAAETLASDGYPIYVLPLESGYPRLAITAGDVPRAVDSGSTTHVRGVMREAGEGQTRAILSVGRNPGLRGGDDHFGSALETEAEVNIDQWARLRQPLRFDGFGLQFAELVLRDGRGGEHKRRYFTQVKRPPRILAVGGDQRWIAGISPDVAEIDQTRPEGMMERHTIADYDAVVLSGVFAKRLSEKAMTSLTQAMATKGVGLFVINGNHEGLSEEAPSVLMSYKETPLAELLPVHPGPRPFLPDPPPRQIVILVDTSGSMGGWRLKKSKEICRHIITNLLRPKDTLDLLTFTTGVGHLVKREHMDERGKQLALGKVDTMKSGGGTDPREALKMIAGRHMTDCGLIFISDGEFADVSYRPDCRATVFAVGQSSVPGNSPLYKLADPFPVAQDFDPTEIRIPYFQPKPRKKYYERPDFEPLPIERFLREGEAIPVPPITMAGAAVSHIKADAELIAVRPKLTDPVLAYRDSGKGRVGVFTGGIGPRQTGTQEGREALERWLREVIAYTARDRYDFHIVDHGETMDMEISLLSKQGRLPEVDQLELSLEVEDGAQIGLLLRANPLVPGSFEGKVRIPRKGHTRRAKLKLRELGPDALPRAQMIPMLIPAGGLVSGSLSGEAYSYGTNEQLLRQLADTGGGIYDPPPQTPLFRSGTPQADSRPLKHIPILIALAALLTAFTLRRWE